MLIENIILSAFVTIFSVGLFVISLASFRKYHNTKLLAVSLVFLVFLIKGILMSVGLFFDNVARMYFIPYDGFFDLCILILLFITTLKR
jgi:hypothetical protein